MTFISRSLWITVRALCLLLIPIGISLAAPTSTPAILSFIDVIKDASIDGLNLSSATVVSPDGQFVYVTGEGEDALAVFTRSTLSGSLNYVEFYRDGVNGVDGLNTPMAATISPDGKHVYVASRDDNAVAVFSRDAISGTLTYVEMQQDGVGGVDGLAGAHAITISPDGKHVYASSDFDDAVAVFSRNAISGTLTFVEMQKDGVGGVDGLDSSRGVTISPDGKHVYATSTNDDAVAVFSRNSTSGALTFVEMKKDGVGGVNGLNGARAATVSPDGKHVYATGVVDDAVAVFSRDAISGTLTFVEMEQDETGGVSGLDFAISVLVSPDGSYVYVAGYNDDAITIFSRDSSTGALTFVETVQNGVNGVEALDGPNWLAVSPGGEHVYVPGRVVSAVVAFSRNGTTGALTYLEANLDGAGVDGLAGAHAVAFSPDGQHAYVAGYGENALAVLRRNTATGQLTFVVRYIDGISVDGLWSVSSTAVSPDGKHVYAAGASDDAVAMFSRDAFSGTLTYDGIVQDGIGGVDGLDGAETVTLSPDGKHVYVAGPSDNAVAVFSRDAISGTLTFVEMQKDGVGGVDGLAIAHWVAVSPDGKNVYAASGQDDAVAVFSRNATTGALTFVEIEKDGVGGVDGLDHARSVTVSPDGKHVYVTSNADNAVVAFSRDATTGALTFIEMKKDGVGGVDGLAGAYDVTMSSSGGFVYVTGELDNAIAVFSRDTATGALTFLSAQKDGVNGVDGLAGPRGVAVSPGGEQVYVAGFADDAVAIFRGERRVFLPLILKNH